jgi:long-chain fatty acid transport protein
LPAFRDGIVLGNKVHQRRGQSCKIRNVKTYLSALLSLCQAHGVKCFIPAGLILTFSASLTPAARADLFHYSNLLIGQRALGLGGAFTALSDDTSGLYYNPGGLALQSSIELSGSINTFYLKKNNYEKVFGDKEFTETSRGSVSSFFGLSKRIALPLFGTVQVGLAFINPDAAQSDENVLVENEPEPNIVRYHRAANIRTGSSQVIVGAAGQIGKESGLGCAVSYLDVDELEQIYQDAVLGPVTAEELPDTAIYSNLAQNERTHLVLRGGGLRCGVRLGFQSGVKLGISYQYNEIVYQRMDYDFSANRVFVDANGKVVVISEPRNSNYSGSLLRNIARIQSRDVVTLWPDEIRLGFAYQPFKALTLTGDAVRYGAGKGSFVRVKRAEVINLAAGSELMIANTLFLRSGYFTNKDATFSRDLDNPSQREEYMDYRGFSFSTGLKLRTADYGIHYTEQRGSGYAEKVKGKQNPSSGRLQVISISATQSFQ